MRIVKKISFLVVCCAILIVLSSCQLGRSINVIEEDDPLACVLDCQSTHFNIELARICAEFSEVSEKESPNEVENAYKNYGISNIKSYNYSKSPISGGAVTVGTVLINKNEENIPVIIITARGSSTMAELLGDQRLFEEISFGRKKDFLQYQVWDNVLDFSNKMAERMNSYAKPILDKFGEDNVVFIITGHSLGGAAANLFAADLMSGESDTKLKLGPVAKENVYVYTYNAITVLTTKDNVEHGYENIHNVYNYYDSFGPNGNQKSWNASSPYAKFGHTELYYRQEEEFGLSAYSHGNYRFALQYPEQTGLSVCTEIKEYNKSDYFEEPQEGPVIEVENDPEEEHVSEDSIEHNQYEYSDYGIVNGTYISDDLLRQVFVFSGQNEISMNAFGFKGEGTYEIKNGSLYVYYALDFFGYNIGGDNSKWVQSFEKESDSVLIIANTRFVREE